jgi:hypothetical protein
MSALAYALEIVQQVTVLAALTGGALYAVIGGATWKALR